MRSILMAMTILTVFSADGFAQPRQQWIRQLGSNAPDAACSVNSDCWGDIFVTGFVSGELVRPVSGPTDCFLAKYSSAGTLLWIRQWGTSGEDRAWEVVADQFGNAWVVTENTGEGGAEGDAFLTSFTTCGTLRGTWSVGRVTGTFTRPVNVCVAPNFRVLVATDAPSRREAIVSAFDMAGCQRWSQRYQYDDEYHLADITTDCCGNIFAVRSCHIRGFKGAVTRFDPCGREIWTHSTGESSAPCALAADDRGHIWVGGSQLTNTETATLSKFGIDGTRVSTFTATGTGLARIERLVPCGDSVFATGFFRNAAGDDQFVARFDLGRVDWSSLIGTRSPGENGIALDGRGNLTVCGKVNGTLPGQASHGQADAFVIQYHCIESK